jgi:hypothetical protein
MKVGKFTLINIGNRAKAVDWTTLKDNAALENKKQIADTIRLQLRAGESYVGQMPDYGGKGYYADYKAKLQSYVAPFPKTDLYLTGGFHKSVGVEAYKGDYNGFSKHTLADELTRRYGENIFMLNPKFAQIVTPRTTRLFIANYFEYLLK